FFREEGLDVTIVPGAAGDVNLSTLGGGKVDFCNIDYAGALMRVGTGAFDDFTMIASMHSRTLIALDALRGSKSGITGPFDLAGKKIIQPTGSVVRRLFPAWATLLNINTSKIEWL